MMRRLHGVWSLCARMAAIVVAFGLIGHGAVAETQKPLKGVALVIGQSGYKKLPSLANPKNDAQALSDLFSSLGLTVTTVMDRSSKQLRRDFENFAADAEGADVALIYYSGHGIEAGGENWLIPTDADMSSLEDAERRLVPLSGLLDEVRRAVPITILFLDACRSNPFQTSTVLKRNGDAVAIGATGLSEVRGATPVEDVAPSAADLGSLIGFAAAPRQAALDGPAGGNSPYAAALLRHLSASSGAEFGIVMRMVTEEVYLKTDRKQRPWVNETLTRLLYFGGAGDDPQGEESEILGERRGMLLTMSALPDDQRRQVEKTAASAGVPLDALYGLLNTLGVAAPKDPAELEKVLKTQTATIKSKQERLAALDFDDSEIKRLTGLAERALADGALEANSRFMNAAITRYEQVVRPRRDSVEAQVKASRLDAGALYAKGAQADELKFDFAAAALKYGKAFAEVAKWDDATALDYKAMEAMALYNQGDQKGDNNALRQAVDTYEDMLLLSPRKTKPLDWAATQNNLGNTLWVMGQRESDTARLEKAVSAFRLALEERTRERAPLDWAVTESNLGNALLTLGQRESGTARLEEAVTAYRSALGEGTRGRAPLEWAMTQNNLGYALWTLGQRESGTARLEESVAAYRAALQERTRERSPLDWAATQNNLGNAFWTLGQREGGTARLEEAVTAHRAALEERRRERVPLDWAATQNNLGNALWTIGQRESGTARLEEAVTAYRAALEERTRARVPLDWAQTQNNLGNVLWTIGLRETGTARLEAAVAAYRAALEERRRERVPLDWAATQSNLGNALQALGQRENGTARLEAAAASFRAALTELTRERVPLDWAMAQSNLGNTLALLGQRENSAARLEEAATAHRAALEERTRARVPFDWAATQNNLGYVLAMLGLREKGTTRLKEAATAYRAAATEMTRERAPLDWGSAQNNLGYLLILIGERENDNASRYEEALPILRDAYAFQAAAGSRSVAFTTNNLCRVLLDLGRAKRNRAMLAEAESHCRTALAETTQLGMSDLANEVGSNLKAVEAAARMFP
ncbi:MAG: caspase family protein [Pseudomonadota bacterium]